MISGSKRTEQVDSTAIGQPDVEQQNVRPRGIGVRTAAGLSADPGSVGDYYWGGAGGTYFWVDPKEKMFVVFMMQSPKQRLTYRAVMRDMVYAAMTK